jgi:Ca2+-transporting ATPase
MSSYPSASNGLKASEVDASRKIHGANVIPSEKKVSLLSQIINVASEPMLILLISAGVINFFLAEFLDASMLMFTVVIVLGISIIQARRTENALFALQQLSTPHAKVIRDGIEIRIPSNEVVVGDLLLLYEGDRICADASIVSGAAITTDESTLTGESAPVSKEIGEALFSGTLVVRGHGQAKVTAVGTASALGRIGKSLQEIPFEKSRLQRDVDQLVRVIGLLGIVTVLAVVIIYGSTRNDWLEGALAGIAAAMALIPEEFPVILTLFMAIGAWRMSQVRVIARKPSAIEALGSITALCVDKTGTLTLNRMEISQIHLDGKRYEIDVSELDDDFLHIIHIGGLACPNSIFDPMDQAFRNLTEKYSINMPAESIQEFPLQSGRMAYIHCWRIHEEIVVAAKGAPETIARMCGFNAEQIQEISARVHEAANQGFRVLAIAEARVKSKSEIPINIEDLRLSYLGLALLQDPVREGVVNSIAECARAGIRTIMITGDHPSTAQAIAREIGLTNPQLVITGTIVDSLNDQEIAERISGVSIFARVTPEHKLRIIRALQRNGEIVAMTGDGVNDAPALRAANVGIAMGERGTDVAREAAALIITDDDYNSIARGIHRGRTIFANLQKAMSYVVAIHIPIFGLALLPIFSLSWPLILLPGLVAFHEVIIDPACSIVFEEEGSDPDIMKRAPRGIERRVFNISELAISIAQGTVVLLALITLFLYSFNAGRNDGEIRSLIFGTLMLSNVGLILTNRSRTLTTIEAFRKRKNRAVNWVVLGALVILASLLSIPPLQLIFDLESLALRDWFLILLISITSVGWYDLLKLLKRKSSPVNI